MKIDRRVAEYLLARIASGEYPPGEPVPSVRRLARKFALPPSTVHRHLQALARSGLLASRPGKGFVVVRAEIPDFNSPRRLLALITPKVLRKYTSITYVALLRFQQLANAAGYEVAIRPLAYDELDQAKFRELAADCRGAALFMEYDARMAAFDLDFPAVATLMANTYGGRISLVNLDENQMAELATAFFLSRGLRKLAIIANAPPVYRRRAETMAAKWLAAGGECWTYQLPDLPPEFTADTGYFFTSDSNLVIRCRHYQRECGRCFERDFAVLGVGGKRNLNPDWPPFPSVGVDWQEVGETMFLELERLLNRPDAARRSILLGGKLRSDDPAQAPLPSSFAAERADFFETEIFHEPRPPACDLPDRPRLTKTT